MSYLTDPAELGRLDRVGKVAVVRDLLTRHAARDGEPKAVVTRLREIRDEMERIADHEKPTGVQRARLDELSSEAEGLGEQLVQAHHSALQQRMAANPGDYKIASGVMTPDPPDVVSRFQGDPWSPAESLEVVDRARYALDTVARSNSLPSDRGAVERATHALDGHDGADGSTLARWAAVTSDPNYLRAFMRLAADPLNGHRSFTPEELHAFQRTETLSRAMSLADASGGFLVPFQLDPSVIITGAGSANPVRRIARVVLATGDVWNGVSSVGVTATWLAEAAEAADASPVLAQPAIPNFKASAFIPVSYEAFDDMANGAAEVAKLLLDGKEQLEASAFIKGSGTGQPTGIATALPAAQRVATAAADVLASGDLYRVQEALGPRFQASAQWAANLVTLNQIAKFETAAGARQFESINNTPPALLRKPIHEASALDTAGATALAGNDFVMVYGDWQHYVITDRVGTRIELIPNLFGAAQRPTGQRGWFMWARVGADSVADNAFRLLTA